MKNQATVGPPSADYWNSKTVICNGCKTARLEHEVFADRTACSFCMKPQEESPFEPAFELKVIEFNGNDKLGHNLRSRLPPF